MKISEKCGCGAEIVVEHPNLDQIVQAAVDRWRDTHRCTGHRPSGGPASGMTSQVGFTSRDAHRRVTVV